MGNCCCQPDETFEIKRPLKEKVKKWKLNEELIAQTQLWTEFTKDQFDSYGSQSFQILCDHAASGTAAFTSGSE